MGGCCSSDNIPEVPPEIKADPDINRQITVEVARLGYWGMSRDYGIWENLRPDNADEAKKLIWLWFNKSNTGPNQAKIDLENFVRNDPNDKNKGKVLYTAHFLERPAFQCFSRWAGTGNDSFFGFFDSGNYQGYNDDFYVNHNRHSTRCNQGHNLGSIITKWSLSTNSRIFDGNTGRCADDLQKDFILLEVYSTGTVVTTYRRVERQEPIHDSEGRVTGHRTVHHIEKTETEYVDRIEFRATVRGQLLGQWSVNGDTYFNSGDVVLDSPFFNTVLAGGWFTRSKFRISTKANYDPALAILISHLCSTEYSVEEIKRDLQVRTPSEPPHMGWGGVGGMNLHHQFQPSNGDFHFHGRRY